MKISKLKNQKLINPVVIISFAAIFRLFPHPANFVPIAAMALFGGVYLNKKYALVVPLIALFVSDIFLGFYKEMPFVYGSFFLTGLIGIWLKDHKSLFNIALGTFISSLLFFLITNFSVWFLGGVYTKTLNGLIECYYLALPFFRNTIMGDFFYVTSFFGSYELVLMWLKRKGLIKQYVK